MSDEEEYIDRISELARELKAYKLVAYTYQDALRGLLKHPDCQHRDTEQHLRQFCGCARHTAIRLVGLGDTPPNPHSITEIELGKYEVSPGKYMAADTLPGSY